MAFGQQRSGNLALGVAQTEAKVIAESQTTKRELDCGASRQLLKPNSVSRINVKGAQLVDSTAFSASISDAEGDRSSEALIFVHGYNTSLNDAIMRGAQIAGSIDFNGHVFVFSWPSAASTLRYDYDRESILASRDQLRWLMQLIENEFKAKRIFIVAHSMGNQLITEVLREMEAYRKDLPVSYEYIMAAPDVDIDVFKDAMSAISRLKINITQYVSSGDKALWSSHLKSGQVRVGSFRGATPNLFAGVDVVDISQRAEWTFSLNHSAYADDPYVLFDLYALIKNRLRPPNARSKRMKEITQDGQKFWRLEVGREEEP